MTIIVVDAWKYCEQEDVDRFPFLEKETKSFGSYIDSCLIELRKHHDIVHCADGRPIMDEIDTSQDTVIRMISDINHPGPYFFCGFHLGRCIDRKIKELNKECYVIKNLCLLFPADGYERVDKNLNYCYYTHSKGLEKL